MYRNLSVLCGLHSLITELLESLLQLRFIRLLGIISDINFLLFSACLDLFHTFFKAEIPLYFVLAVGAVHLRSRSENNSLELFC